MTALVGEMERRWRQAVEKAGGIVGERGFVLEESPDVGYLAKGVTFSQNPGQSTPWDLLVDAALGDGDAAMRFGEFAAFTKGKHLLRASDGHAEALGVRTKRPGRKKSKRSQGRLVRSLSLAEWRRAHETGRRAGLLADPHMRL